MAKQSKEETLLEKFRPKKGKEYSTKLSSYFPKDELFIGLRKSFLKNKNKETESGSIPADWKKMQINNVPFILYKDTAVPESIVRLFDEDMKKRYLRKKTEKVADKKED